MFCGEDYLYSRSVGSGSTTTDGNESSPNPVHENGNYFLSARHLYDPRNNCAVPVPFSILKWRINLLIIGNWAFSHTKLTAMICLSDHQTIASQWAIPNARCNLLNKSPLFYFASLQVIQSLSICPRLVGFVMNILAKLITKQVKVVPLITFRYMTFIF